MYVKVNPQTKINSTEVLYVPMNAVNIQYGCIDYLEKRKIIENSGLPRFINNDVLFARITPSTENGKICIVEKFKGEGIASSELVVLRATEKVLPRYLFYFVQSHRIKDYAVSQMMGTTERQRVPDRVFTNDLNFELPSIIEQQKIASILSKVDELIQKTDQIIEQSQRLKRGLIQRLLTRGIGHSKFKRLLSEKIEINIPDKWKIVSFKDVSNRITYGFTNPMPRAKDGPWLITAKDIKNGKLNYLTAEKTTWSSFNNDLSDKSRPRIGTVLVTKDDTLGQVAITDKDNICINQSVVSIEPNESITSKFLAFVLQSPYIQRIIETSSPATTIRHISITDLAVWKFGLPSPSEQQQISRMIDEQIEQIENLINYGKQIKILKMGLMQQLLTGKIRVKV